MNGVAAPIFDVPPGGSAHSLRRDRFLARLGGQAVGSGDRADSPAMERTDMTEGDIFAVPAAVETAVSRRHLVAGSLGVGAALAAPARAAQTPGRTAPLTSIGLDLAYEAIVTLGPVEQVGITPVGKRVRIPITGGTFAGPRLSGTILPEGMDWQVVRSDGFTMVEASYLMREADGTLIHIYNKGLAGKDYVRTTPVFEVPMGKHGWLNQAVFLGMIGPVPERRDPAVRITVYRVA
ncbi:DUF3237 family protein [Sphingomonas sp. CV7422]|uniref:DUF3237 family protein n=1 Tax=Sphingomonas sp. CV7422 TaxID=3018036 RepID=UPI0022FE4A74|nr:DUF3237 family protein [Sphingomonas sp. CV7422]